MAISSYLRECGYELGGLLPKVYLVHKNALKLSKKAKGLEVSVVSRNDGDIYCVEGQLCTYKQDETYNGKYRFNSTLELTINELYREPFLYGLRTLRTNEYYIIIEDKKGVQYLINPELYTKMSYEYSFSDTSGNNNHIIITYNNLSNYPLLIFEENISDNKSLLNKQCEYNYGQVYELLMFDHKDLKVKDDGVKVDEMYIENVDDICEIDFMKESFSLTETYDGKTFIASLAFNIPLNDQYGWAYRLLEFKDNKYAAILRTTNDNYIIVGVERGLFPSYTIETSEDDNVPNMVKVVFEQRSQYPILYTDEITQYRWVESEPLCFGFDRYQMLVKEKSEDWGETWVVVDPIVKKKGKIIETDSEACKEYQWVEDGEYCDIDNITYIKWENVDGFICEGGNKYHKTRRYVSEDGKSFSPSDEYGRGELIEEDSKECQYVAVRWVEDDYECYEVNEEYTRWIENEEVCSGVTLYQGQYEEVSSNGIAYYESGEERLGDVIRDNCCACGYREEDWRDEGLICGKDIPNINIISYEGDWERKGNQFDFKGYKEEWPDSLKVYFSTKEKIGLRLIVNSTKYSLVVNKIDSTGNVGSTKYAPRETPYTVIIEVGDANEHFILFHWEKTLYTSTADTFNTYITFLDSSEIYEPTTKYSEQSKHLICDDGVDVVDETTGDIEYTVQETECCECGWTGLTWVFNDEYICGSEIENGIKSYISFTDIDTETPFRTVRIDATDPGTSGYYFIRLSTSPNSTGSNQSYSICPDEGKIWDGGSSKAITAQTHIEGKIYEYTFSRDMYLATNQETYSPLHQVSAYSDRYDHTSKYEIWREAKVCDVSDFTGDIEYRNGIPSCDCGYIDVIYKTEEGYIELTRRQHSNGVYIDTEVAGASDELYSYRANITYSGNSCLGDEIVWSMVSYEITQEYKEEVVNEEYQVPLLFRVIDNYGAEIGYFDVQGNIYNYKYSSWGVLTSLENGIKYETYGGGATIIFPKYSVDAVSYKNVGGYCNDNNYTKYVNLKPYTEQSTSYSLLYDGELALPQDNDATIRLWASTTCNVRGEFYFNVIDDRLFDANFITTYEVINDKRIALNRVLSGYQYRNVIMPYDANDENTYIVENDERYYKVKEQFSLNGNDYFDYVNIIYFKGDKIDN